jgi:hypothetical protein
MKIQVVACFKLKRLASLISIAFLAISGSFQIGMDVVDYLSGLSDKVRTKDHPLARLNPVHTCTAATTIQSFEGWHLETLLIPVVIRELSQWQTPVPLVRIVQHPSSEHILQNLIYPLRLTIGLRMISRALDHMCSQGSMQLFIKRSNELWSSIRNDGLWHTMQT